METIYRKLSEIHLDIEGSNISNTGWYPHEMETEYMSESEITNALSEAKAKDSNVLFTNVFIQYDSCDCSDGMCSHGSWVYEIIVLDGEKKYEIDVQEDYLQIENGNRLASIPIDSSVYDFYRMCQLVGVSLEFSEYAKTLIESPSTLEAENKELREMLVECQRVLTNVQSPATPAIFLYREIDELLNKER